MEERVTDYHQIEAKLLRTITRERRCSTVHYFARSCNDELVSWPTIASFLIAVVVVPFFFFFFLPPVKVL